MFSGLDMQNADARDGGGVHSRIQPCWLTGMHAKRTEGPDMQVGISMDQVAARAIGGETQLASLELALESSDLLGACDLGYTCAYTATLFACHPPGSAAYRIVARLQLVDATGAPVRFSDREALTGISESTRANHYGVRSLVHAIVASDLFQTK